MRMAENFAGIRWNPVPIAVRWLMSRPPGKRLPCHASVEGHACVRSRGRGAFGIFLRKISKLPRARHKTPSGSGPPRFQPTAARLALSELSAGLGSHHSLPDAYYGHSRTIAGMSPRNEKSP